MHNSATLIGRLGADPEVRFLPDGTPVATIRLATDEVWKDDDGEKHQRTEWHRVVCFRRLAEVAGEYLAKGRLVMFEGRIQTRQWEDDQKVKRFTTEIVARNMKMLDSSKTATAQAEAPAGEAAASPADDPDNVPF